MSRRDDELVSVSSRGDLRRRDVLRLLGGGLAALQAGCLVEPGEHVLPYVADPFELRPGVPVRYATALSLDGFATGAIVMTHDGRPTKLDGNPVHPASLGGSMAWLQARILDLYDPQRRQEAVARTQPTSWSRIAEELANLAPSPLWIVMPPQTSPTIAGLLARIRLRHDLHVVYDEPLDHRAAYRGGALVFGRPVEQQLDLARADAVVSLDADWASAMPMSAAWARAAARRRTGNQMSRLWVCEPMPTPTGTLADHRLPARAGDVVAIAVAIAGRLGAGNLPGALVARAERRLGDAVAWAHAAADDLGARRGAGVVVVGDRQPAAVHALGRLIDAACGNLGATVSLTPPARLDPLGSATLDELVTAVGRDVAARVIAIDCNPVYSAPRALALGTVLRMMPWSLHAGLWHDETGRACAIRVPLAHQLEAWADPRAYDGTLSFAQPVIRPRFEVVSPIEILAALAGERRDARALVHERVPEEAAWRAALAHGVVAGSTERPVDLAPSPAGELIPELARLLAAPAAIELAIAPSQLHDGRFSGNAWLQELPQSITKQVWGNAALIAPQTAGELGVRDGELLRLTSEAGQLELPALIVPGHAERAVTIEAGYGRETPELPIADRVGANAFALVRGTAISPVTTRAAGGSRRLVRTQLQTSPLDRPVAPFFDIGALAEHVHALEELRGPVASLLPEVVRTGLQWAMSIDTSICTGCSACVIACQAENNVQVVGAKEVARGRVMHWLRIDTYLVDRSEPGGGERVNQPMLCQHCENAPCEYVCPVAATVHSPDGLNEQVYNRCIGTRFCSNNCPYKVRRFNWFALEDKSTRSLQYNPEVTVRSRGVMEKCTYCVQRIRGAEHRARVEHREIAPTEVVTACQQACPTGAIQFGALDHAPIAALRRDPRRYDVLHDLGTRPRTQYLAKLKNPRTGR